MAATDRETIGVAQQGLFLQATAGGIDLAIPNGRKQANPPNRQIFERPCERSQRINPQHDVHMVAHHGIGMDADCKDIGKLG
jgi:hypothetical protein